MTKSTDPIIEDRYKKDSNTKLSFAKIRLIAILLIILSLVFGYFFWKNQQDKTGINAKVLGYEVVDNSNIKINFSLTKTHPKQQVDCILRAKDYHSNEIGRREILIPASTEKTTNVEANIITSNSPFIADVVECSDKIPTYLKTAEKIS